jgi:hypothetical protein
MKKKLTKYYFKIERLNHLFKIVLIIFFTTSCATKFFMTKDYISKQIACRIDAEWWHTNQTKACDWLSIKNEKESRPFDQNLYKSVSYGSACLQNLSSMISSAKNDTISENEYNKIAISTLNICNSLLFDLATKEKLSYYYASVIEGLFITADKFCEIQYSAVLNKKNLNNSQIVPSFCHKMIVLSQEYPVHFAPNVLIEKKHYFDKAVLVSSGLCNAGDKIACELSPKSKSLLAYVMGEQKKAKVLQTEKLRIEKEKLASEQAVQKEINQCTQGDKNKCWDLYVANRSNQHGYQFLRDACLLGHPQACQTKLIIDEETSRKETERNAQISIENERRESLYKGMSCTTKNNPLTGNYCDSSCPGYEGCIERRERNRDMYKKPKRTSCSPDFLGGFNCTEY